MKKYKLNFNSQSGFYEMQENLLGEYVKYDDHLKEMGRILEEDNPSKDALDWLWNEIILKYRPDYGTWEYPAQAYRHIICEFEELRSKLNQISKPNCSLPPSSSETTKGG